MRFRLIVAVTGFACATLLASNGQAVTEPEVPAKPPTKNVVQEMMIKAHKGAKSPLAQTGEELKKDSPDWDEIVKNTKVFNEMATTLKDNPTYGSKVKYVAAATELGKAVGEKDKKAAAEAFLKLNKSCSSCHYGIPAEPELRAWSLARWQLIEAE